MSRKYFVYKNSEDDDIVCTVPGAAWNNTNNLVTATTRYASGPFLDETQTILRPDGTMSIYGYDSTSTTKTTTVDTGQPDETGTTIVSGTRSVTVVGQTGELVSQTSLDIASGGIVLSQDTVNPGDYDDERRPTRINHLDGTADLMNYDCCGLASTTDRDGVTTSFAYDDLKRLVQSTHLGISSLYTYDPAGNKTSESRVGTDSVAHALHGYAYDVAGRGVAETNATGVITTYSESYNPATGLTTRTTTTAFGTSDQATRIAVYAADGLLLSVTGTAVNPVRYAYGVEPESGVYRLFTQQIKLDLSGNDTPEWTKTYYDMAGRAYKTVYAAASGTPAAQTYFNTYGQLSEQVDPDGVITVFLYNGRGELQDTVLDANRNGSLDLAGLDRVTRNIQDAIHNSTYGCDVQRTRTFVFPNNNDGATSNEISRVERSTDGLRTWNTTPGLSGLTVVSSTQVAYNPVTGIRTETVTAPDGSCVIRTYTNGRLTASTQYAYGGAQTGQTTYTYDANGRLAATIDARNGATSYSYDNADRIVTTTTPPPGNGQSAQTTTSSYDNQGRVWKTVLPDGTSVTNQYYSNGLLYQTSGSRTYPVRYAYDAQGRMTSMTTWSSLAGGTGAATTTWSYDPYRGWLASKRDAAGNGCDYTYSPSGRLSTRLWGRGSPRLQTSYGYDVFGSPSSITYSDGLTPSVSFTYDRRGRQIGVVDGACTISRSYNDANLFTGESYAGGTLGGFSVTNTYDSVLRKGSAGVRNPSGAAFASATYGYDGASRLSTVSGAGSVTYTYLANSPLIGNILFQQSGTTRLAVNKSYDYLNRLAGISSLPTGAPGWSYGYRYNDANQRIQAALADGSFWVYQYDALGQVISGKRYWSDWTPVAGQQFEYGFDDVGNRFLTKAGGDAHGTSLRSSPYSPNNLNEYSGRSVPGAMDVLGIANLNATVTVGGQPAYRQGEYFEKTVSISNGSGPAYQAITTMALNGSSSNSVTGNVLLAPSSESYGHDLDGNLTADGLWTYTWNAENQLTTIQSASAVATAAKRKVDFEYDWLGRRISKTVRTTADGINYISPITTKFIYDGWNLVGEFDSSNNRMREYCWGSDLSGSAQGAGGVGGLVSVSTGSATYFPVYDGNGNVEGFIDSSTGATAALFEYGPFGEVIRATSSITPAIPIRWSTKYTDLETDLVYYGYRYYNPSTGRWLSRDPIGEKGGPNLYGFVQNNPITGFDPDGRDPQVIKCGGVCGAVADDWFLDEILAQLQGWDRWKRNNNKKSPTINDYLPWANGNQRYKDKNFFTFNTKTGCGSQDDESIQGSGCGRSVTLCGNCVRSAILGLKQACLERAIGSAVFLTMEMLLCAVNTPFFAKKTR